MKSKPNRISSACSFSFCFQQTASQSPRVSNNSNRSARNRLLVFSVSLLLLPRISFALTDDAELRSQFLQGIEIADQKIQALSIRASCKVSNTTTIDVNKAPLERSDAFDCAISGSNSMMSGLETGGVTYFRVRNDKYAFALDKTQTRERGTLRYVEQLGVSPAVDAQVAEYNGMVRGVAMAGYYLWQQPIFRSFHDKVFTINQVRAISTEGGELVRVDFAGIVTEPAEDGSGEVPAYTYSNAFLICDPTKNWVLKEYAADVYVHVNKGNARHQIKLNIGRTIRNVPLATRIESNVSSLDSVVKIDRITEVEFDEREVKDNEFVLSHYGLPEPNFQQSWFGRGVWYLIGGVFFFGSGWLIFKRGARRSQPR